MSATIQHFFDPATSTYSYVVADHSTGYCAIIDPVLDYDAASGRVSNAGARRILDHVREQALTVQWLLETHLHADHLSAAAWLKAELGGRSPSAPASPRYSAPSQDCSTWARIFPATAASSTTCSRTASVSASANCRPRHCTRRAIRRPA